MSAGAAAAEPADRNDSRLLQVDGLRAIAALSVLAFHYTTRFDQVIGHATPVGVAMPYGYLGVNLFFAISGFVIYMTLDRVRQPLDFVVSRLSRLYPTYWIAVVTTWTLVTAFSPGGYDVTWQQAIVNLTMLQNFVGVPDVDSVYWSLQVELVFYVWMLALWVSGAMRHSVSVIALWVVASLVATTVERVTSLHVPYSIKYFALMQWIPWFALGMTAYITRRDQAFRAGHALIIALSLAAIGARLEAATTMTGIVTVIAIFGASRQRLGWLAWKPLTFFGVISYPLYLVHERFGWLVIASLERSQVAAWIAVLLAFAAATGMAALLHYFVEQSSAKAIRGRYKRVAAAHPPVIFSRASWTGGCIAVIVILASAMVITSRMQKMSRDAGTGTRDALTAPLI